MTRRHGRRARVPFGLVLIALGIAVGILAYVVGRADDEAGARGAGATSTARTPKGAADPTGVTGSAEPTSPAPDPRRAIVIHGTGDVSLDPSYIPALASNGYGWAWSGLDGLFRRDDLTVINHECPSTDIVAPLDKQFVFRCDPDALDEARAAGVDVASLANNHGFDQGPDALLDSMRHMKRADIMPIGAGASQELADAPAYVEVKGWTIGLVGVGEVTDPDSQVAVGDEIGTSVGHDFGRALRAIREAEANADLVIVVIHWGVELDTQPREYQVDEAHRMIDAGADVIFGHHAHRLQPMDTYEGRPIFYGLGNFVWPRFSAEGSTTAVAEVVVRPDGSIRGRLLPATIVSDGHPVLNPSR
ncbi:MAG TPA: CapA family protein [Actinomycetota bacterium]|nr:CapA family protein [Actinomycetota bacterium]